MTDDRSGTDVGVAKRTWLGPLVAVCTLLASLFVAELGLWVLAPVPDPYAREKERSINHFIRTDHPPHDSVRLDIDEPLPGVRSSGIFTTNNKGYRGLPLRAPKPESEWRVVLVGGSTVEAFIVDDRDSPDAVLERELQARVTGDRRVRVFNAGVSGHRSDDHVSLIVHRILHQEPDLVAVLAGVNDLIAAVHEMDYEHYGADWRSQETRWGLYSLAKMAATEFQIPRRLVYASRRLRTGGGGTIEEGVARSNYRDGIQRLQSGQPAPDPPRTDREPYAVNLRTIAGAAAAQGVDLVFITQPSTWNSKIDPGTKEWHWLRHIAGQTYTEQSADAALELYNDTMRQVASELGVPLFDLAAVLPKSREYLFDDVHFNVKGSRLAALELADFLEGHGLIP